MDTLTPLRLPEPSFMTDDLRIFQESVERFLKSEMMPHVVEWEEGQQVDRRYWKSCGEAGLLMVSASEEYGGGGGTFAHEAILSEASARLGLDGIVIETHNVVIGRYLSKFGSEEQKQRWIPPMATGDVMASLAMSEPGAGSDVQAIKTSAVRDGDEYIINGQKTFITMGYTSDLVIVACKTSPEARGNGISLLLVEADRRGFSRGRKLDKVGNRTHGTAELFFQDVRVPVANLLGPEENKGFSQLKSNLVEERLIIAIQSMGLVERAIAITLEYVKNRKAFGKRVIDFQNSEFKLAECVTEATIGKSFVNNCIQMHLAGQLDDTTAAMAKYWTTELQGRVVDTCVQLHGGYGFMNEYEIARMYRNARVSRIYGGTNEIMKMIIGRSL